MSSKYNRFLLSTCLPVMALGLCLPMAANAGFEWTPPEKTQPVEVTPEADMGDMDTAVTPDPMTEDDMVETDVMSDEEPPIAITVIEDDEEPMEEEVEIVIIEDTEEQMDEADSAPVEPEEDVMIEQAETQEMPAEAMEEAVEVEVVEIIEEEVETPEETEMHSQEPVIEVVEAMDVENSEAPEKSDSANSLSLNPYPLENQEEEQVIASADPMAEHIQWNVPETFDVVEGFGKEMPLALALSQIVPAEYAYSFGDGVNPGMRISWQGGKPWNEVLSDALEPHQVGVAVRYKKVLLNPIVEEQTAALEEEATMEADDASASDADVIEPDFQQDVDAVEEQPMEEPAKVETMEEEMDASKDTMEEMTEEAEETPEEVMNDALREVYGEDPMDKGDMPDAEPIDLQDDKGASNSIVEELLEPVEVTAEEEANIPHPDMNDLADKAEEKEESLVERINILDPGPEEGVQPSMAGTEDADADMQKKLN